MKKILFMVMILFMGFNHGHAQEVIPSNQTVIRLTVVKDDKILMRKTPYGWMTPAVYYTKRQTPTEVLDSLRITFGIKTTIPYLKGLFTYKYDFKPTADIRLLYVSHYESGELKSTVKDEEVYWLPIDEALDKLEETVPSLRKMTKQILNYPETIWGGSFLLYREKGNLTSMMEESFYSVI